MMEFRMGFLDLDARRHKIYPLTVYSSTKGLAVVGVFIQFQNRH
jgi:hypothetical protein